MSELPAREMTTAALLEELGQWDKKFDDFRQSLDESGGMAGSPGESLYERLMELETELIKRGKECLA